jgi:glycosyltransferase involved in cell wall biosynthesis
MKNEPLISIIMPALNAEAYIGEAIVSVQDQTWSNWELIIVDNGSSDSTLDRVANFNDPRITVLRQPIRGVSRARNVALGHLKGAYYCFLDADDRLPSRSLEARVLMLENDRSMMFADGNVDRWDHHTGVLSAQHRPDFIGPPFTALMEMRATVFFGLSWMIRRCQATEARFQEHLSHCEDLAFYLSIARAGNYTHTSEVVLHYRTGHGSAMTDIRALDKGYLALYQWATSFLPPPDKVDLHNLWRRIRRVMFRGFLKRGMPFDALRVLLRREPRIRSSQ